MPTATQIRLSDETYEKLKIIAGKELRSLNSQMEYFLIRGIERYEEENEKINVDFLYEGQPDIDD